MGRTANIDKEKYGNWATVIGAAEGLGEAFCQALARKSMNIIMVDIQADKLSPVSSHLETLYGIQTLKISTDLSDISSCDRVIAEIKNLDCRLLIYNAAFSIVNDFMEFTEEELDRFIHVNIRTQTRLIHRFSRHLSQSGITGGIIVMSSLAGIFGTHKVTLYSASKAYTIILAEALQYELLKYGIDIMVCIAGATDTPTFRSSHPNTRGIPVMQARKVAEQALSALGSKNVYIPGWKNRTNYFLLRKLLPRKFSVYLVNRAIRRMYL